jgi:RNA polymerase sigma-70 factor (ECF subfamily)
MTTTLTIEKFTELTSVADLVRAAQGGDHDAFSMLVGRYERAVFATAIKRLKNYTDAQELSQEVFVRAFQKIGQLRTPEAFGGWLRQITDRMAINLIVRRRPDRPTEPETLEATCVSEDSPLDTILAAERRLQVREGLERLRDLDRLTLEAFYVDGETLIEMARRFDAPVGTIKRRLHVARKRLAKEVEEVVAL